MAGALAVSVLVSPAVAPAVLAASVDNHSLWPVLRQARVGGDIIKFRTLHRELTDGRELQFFGPDDPRASIVGRFLRLSGLDEIPQLPQVLHGELSLIGSRAHLPEALDDLHDANPEAFETWHSVTQKHKRGMISPAFEDLRRWHLSPEFASRFMTRETDYVLNTASIVTDLRILGRVPLKILSRRSPTAASVPDEAMAVGLAAEDGEPAG